MIIRIGEMEWHNLKKQFTCPNHGECQHLRLKYIEHGDQILCMDCEKQVSAVWALRMYFTQHERQKERIEAESKALEEEKNRLVTHRAALAVQDAWNRRKYVPTCPHCYKAIGPQDGFGKSAAGKNGRAEEIKPLLMMPVLEKV